MLGAPSHIYIGGREGGAAKGDTQVGGILLGGLLQFGLPLSLSPEGGRKEGRGERKGESYSLYFLSSPFSFLHLDQPIWGRTIPRGAGLSRPRPNKAHIFAEGCPGPLLVTRFLPGMSRNTSGVQIPTSYISIFTSHPLRDSSSCP